MEQAGEKNTIVMVLIHVSIPKEHIMRSIVLIIVAVCSVCISAEKKPYKATTKYVFVAPAASDTLKSEDDKVVRARMKAAVRAKFLAAVRAAELKRN